MLNETQETLAASVNAEGYWEASNHIRVPLSSLLGKIIESPPLLHASEPEWEESEEEKKETVPLSREQDYLGRCGSKRFAKEMAAVSRFADLDRALQSAREIWFNKIDVNGWLEAFVSHQVIGAASPSISQWSKEEQSTALATATDSTTQKFVEWNARYRAKLGFVFLICASGRGTPAILAELKVYPNQVFKMGSFGSEFCIGTRGIGNKRSEELGRPILEVKVGSKQPSDLMTKEWQEKNIMLGKSFRSVSFF